MNLGQVIGLLVIVISLYILWQIREVLLLIFAAVVLATALNRLARRLQQSGMPRAWSVVLSVVMLLTILTGFFFLIVPPFAAEFRQLADLLPTAIDRLTPWIQQVQSNIPSQLTPYLLPQRASGGNSTLSQQLQQQLQPLVSQLLGGAGAFVSNTLGGILSFLLVLVLTLMMLAQPRAYRQTFVRLFPSFYRRRVDGILDECEVSLGRWIVGALISMSVVACLSVIGLSILRVRLALAQGILAGLLNLIPNIGPTLSVVLPMTIAILDAPWKSGAVLILYFLIQQFESSFLTPYVMAQQVSLLPAITLMSQVFFATFFGFLGLVLALPLTVVGKVWVKEVLIKDVLDQWRSDREVDFHAEGEAESQKASQADQAAAILPNKSPKTQEASSDETGNG